MAKYTSEQIARIIIQSLDDAKIISEKNFILTESLLKSNRSLEDKITNSTIKIDQSSLTSLKEMIDQMENSMKNVKVELRPLLYSITFCLIGLFAWFFTFYFNVKSTQEIRDKYHTELVKSGKILTNENEVFMQKFMIWKEKNPIQNNRLMEEVESISLK